MPGASSMVTSCKATRPKARRSGRRLVVGVMAAALLLSPTPACSPPPSVTPTSPPVATPMVTPVVTPTLPKAPGGAYTAGESAARKDLAVRLGMPEADVRLVSAEPVEWRDSSLGCPKPGMAYAQVITPGFRLILAAGPATYEYHSDLAGHVAACG